MNSMKWIAAGLAGGLVGAMIWAAISYFANTEIGWIAWGVGGLVGLCVRVAAGNEDEGPLPGVGAAAIAIGSVLLGKYLAIHMAVASIAGGFEVGEFTPADMIERNANEIVREREAKGQVVLFRNAKTNENANGEADFPPDIWQEASTKWTSLPADEQQKQMAQARQELQEIMGNLHGVLRQEGFMNSFSPYDALWFILAAITAFRLGSGGGGREE